MKPLVSALPILAQTQPAAPNPLFSLLPFVLLFGGVYFLMIAPQRKKQKEDEKMRSNLQSGDEVMTNGGIFGTITNVKDDRFVIRVGDNTKIEVAKAFIQTVTKRSGDDKK